MSDFYTQLSLDGIFSKLLENANFYCEKRLVFEFAKILEQSGFPIFLEYPTKLEKSPKTEYEDIRVETPLGIFVFEFKYCPSKITVVHGSLKQDTRKRSPSRKRISDFEDDIERTRKKVENKEISGGFCIFITNQKNLISDLKEKFTNHKWFVSSKKGEPKLNTLIVCL